MANDDTFRATPDWQVVKANGADITDGIFSLFNLQDRKIRFEKTNIQPATQGKGTAFLDKDIKVLKYPITSPEKLFCRTDRGTADIGILEA